ncbi:WD repeat-containing protein 63, partial [Coelomomyces lativittatus]
GVSIEKCLLVQDIDWKFGQNYVMCLSEAAIQLFLTPIETALNIETIQSEPPKEEKKKSAGWVSLGTDIEMEEEKIVESREKILYIFSRKRRKLAQHTNFQDFDCDKNTIDLKPTPPCPGTLMRMQLNIGIQASQAMIEIATQTTWNRHRNFSVQYEPLVADEDAVNKLLDNFSFKTKLENSSQKCQSVLTQNTLINIFMNDFAKLGDEDTALHQGSHVSLQEYQSFTDLKYSKDKSISCVTWHPTQKGVLAVACTQRTTLEERVQLGFSVKSRQSLVLIWSFYDPIHPQLILESSDDISSFAFHPQQPYIIAGGCVNGQVLLWDISDYQEKMKNIKRDENEENKTVIVEFIKFIAVSSVEHSHRAAVTDLQWNNYDVNHNGEPLKTENKDTSISQFVTVGLDGQIMFWDLRYKKDLKSLDQVWRPTFKVSIPSMDGTFDYGLTRLSLALASSRFWCATEEGDVIQGDWLADIPSDNGGTTTCLQAASGIHFGPVSDVLRSPFYPNILLSIGGWSCHVWIDDSSVPLLSSPLNEARYTCGAWSPTRPGAFFVARSDGQVEIWDLLDRTHQASHIQAVSSVSISAISVHTYFSKGRPVHQFVAIGDDEGTVHVLEAPRNIFRPSKNEKTLIRGLIDREVKRVAFVAERKAFRIQEKEKQKNDKPLENTTKSTQENTSDGNLLTADAIEKAFLELQGSILETLQGAA